MLVKCELDDERNKQPMPILTHDALICHEKRSKFVQNFNQSGIQTCYPPTANQLRQFCTNLFIHRSFRILFQDSRLDKVKSVIPETLLEPMWLNWAGGGKPVYPREYLPSKIRSRFEQLNLLKLLLTMNNSSSLKTAVMVNCLLNSLAFQ